MCTGTTFDFSQISGNLTSFRDWSIIIPKGINNDLPQILIILIYIFSQLCALTMCLNWTGFIITDMSSSKKRNDVILALVLYETNSNTLLVHILAQKCYQKYLLFQRKLKANFPLTKKLVLLK